MKLSKLVFLIGPALTLVLACNKPPPSGESSGATKTEAKSGGVDPSIEANKIFGKNASLATEITGRGMAPAQPR